jgi:hypothetical protein
MGQPHREKKNSIQKKKKIYIYIYIYIYNVNENGGPMAAAATFGVLAKG